MGRCGEADLALVRNILETERIPCLARNDHFGSMPPGPHIPLDEPTAGRIAVCLALWLGAALGTLNVVLLALWPVSALGTYLETRREDDLLASKFGAAYESYARRTGRLVPRFKTG